MPAAVPARISVVVPTYNRRDLLRQTQHLLAMALAGGRHTGWHAIGLRTPLPAQSADVVILTSRLEGLWDRWGGQITAEAQRVGRQVVGPFPGLGR